MDHCCRRRFRCCDGLICRRLYAISAVAQLGRDVFLKRLDAALARGLKLLQFREPALDHADAAAIFDQVLARVRAAGANLLVNSRHHRTLWQKAGGVHLTAADLAAMKRRPELDWVAASTHSALEIERAAALDVDFVVAGPVQRTATHPERVPLGWTVLGNMLANAAVPVYALGGMRVIDVPSAMRHGAHGIASMSAVWNDDQCARLDESALVSASSLSGRPVIE